MTTPQTPVAEGDEELHEWCIRLAREMRGSAEDADAVACRVGLANPQEWRAIAASRHQAAERYERIASALHALDAVRRERERVAEENRQLRVTLWASHGHDGKYGDDGELQCNQCRTDFKREPASVIEERIVMYNLAHPTQRPATGGG
jgi:hypothetical protein